MESLQQQLGFDHTEDLTKAKIKIEQKYQTELSKTNEGLAKRVARGQLTPEQADTLRGEKAGAADLERRLALEEAEQKADERLSRNLETRVNFYRELARLCAGRRADTPGGNGGTRYLCAGESGEREAAQRAASREGVAIPEMRGGGPTRHHAHSARPARRIRSSYNVSASSMPSLQWARLLAMRRPPGRRAPLWSRICAHSVSSFAGNS